jgi:hypothetical protein
MELIKFKGRIYGRIISNFFVWDSEWETLRPIEKIVWDGNKITFIDDKFKEDIFDPYYGFGSPEMKLLCRKLTDEIQLDIPESDNIPWLNEEWWYDRKCTISPCGSNDKSSWIRFLKYTNSKHKTLRNHLHNRATKRLLSK